MEPVRTSACGNPVHEWSLLPPPGESAWSAPLAWIEVEPHQTLADMVVENKVLVLLDSGSTQLDCGFGLRSVSCDLRAGSIGYFAPGSHLKASRWRWAQARRIAIDLGQVERLDPVLAEPLRRAPAVADLEFHDGELAALMRGLAHEAAAGYPHGRLFTESLLLGLSLRMQRHASGRTPRERGRLSAAHLKALDEFLDGHLGQRISVQMLARTTGFSESQFVRLLKRTIRQTPYQYVLDRRLERARHLVRHSAMPLAWIAQETGFASQSHMTTAFLRRYGEPPGALRRNSRSDPAGEVGPSVSS